LGVVFFSKCEWRENAVSEREQEEDERPKQGTHEDLVEIRNTQLCSKSRLTRLEERTESRPLCVGVESRLCGKKSCLSDVSVRNIGVCRREKEQGREDAKKKSFLFFVLHVHK